MNCDAVVFAKGACKSCTDSAHRGLVSMQVKANEPQLVEKGISAKRVESTLTDLAHRMGAVQDGGLAWGAFTFRKPANSHTLIIGGGPLGALVAMRMSQSGVSNVTLKVLNFSLLLFVL